MIKKIIKQIPNTVTISRIIACIIAAISLVEGSYVSAILLYIYGAISDLIDGFLARRLNATTKLGQKLDPISDKIFALSLIMPAIILGNLLMIIPLIYEAIITSINVKSEKKYHKVHTERVGKFKSASLSITMLLGLLATKMPSIYFAFMPVLSYTMYLEQQSINAYYNQSLENYNMDNIEKQDNTNIETENSKKEKYINLKNELIFYTTIPIEKKDIKIKEKVKYDRY